MADLYDTISDVRHGDAVPLPTITEDDSFILLKVENGDDVRVSLFNLDPETAYQALLGVVMAIG